MKSGIWYKTDGDFTFSKDFRATVYREGNGKYTLEVDGVKVAHDNNFFMPFKVAVELAEARLSIPRALTWKKQVISDAGEQGVWWKASKCGRYTVRQWYNGGGGMCYTLDVDGVRVKEFNADLTRYTIRDVQDIAEKINAGTLTVLDGGKIKCRVTSK